MKKFLPIFIIICITVVFFRPFFTKGFLPIPSDTIIGLYHPFRDYYAKNYPNGIPYKNFLITDPVRQQYPWRNLSLDQMKNMQFPLWNPYAMSGYPLLGNYQSASLYPLNILFAVLPFSLAWSFLVFLQLLLAGIFLYCYLRHFHLDPLACVLGGLAFAFSGFSVAWAQWNTIIHVALWLPLILLAVEKLLKKYSIQWTLILIFAQCSQILGGHLQTLFYSLVITSGYLFLRVWQNGRERYKHFFLITLIVLFLTLLQWFPTLQFILQSARDIDQNMWQKVGWFIPWQHLIQFIIPDFFGNPTTLNYWGTWNYGELVGYIGIFPLLMSLYAIVMRRDKKTYFFTSLLFLSFLFSLPTGISQLPYVLHLPFLSTAQPTRLLFVVDFSLAILCALGFDYYIKHRKNYIFPLLILLGVFALLWGYILGGYKLFMGITPEQLLVAKRNMIFPTFLFLAILVTFVVVKFVKKKELVIIPILFFILLSVFDLLRFAEKFTPFTAREYLFPSTKSIAFLQENTGIYRVMALDSRILPPNFFVIYKLQSIEGYDPLYLRRYAELITSSERGKPDITPPFGFNRIITPHIYDSKIIDLLGVKYIISLSKIDSPQTTKVFEEGQTKIYENKKVLPRIFFVETLERIIGENKNKAINLMYGKDFDPRKRAIAEGFTESEASVFPLLGIGKTEIVKYEENTILIKTQNIHDGFLILTDTFYPSWHAKIDNNPTKIYRADYNFRGIFVPKGEHVVKFYTQVF